MEKRRSALFWGELPKAITTLGPEDKFPRAGPDGQLFLETDRTCWLWRSGKLIRAEKPNAQDTFAGWSHSGVLLQFEKGLFELALAGLRSSKLFGSATYFPGPGGTDYAADDGYLWLVQPESRKRVLRESGGYDTTFSLIGRWLLVSVCDRHHSSLRAFQPRTGKVKTLLETRSMYVNVAEAFDKSQAWITIGIRGGSYNAPPTRCQLYKLDSRTLRLSKVMKMPFWFDHEIEASPGRLVGLQTDYYPLGGSGSVREVDVRHHQWKTLIPDAVGFTALRW